LGAPDGVVEVVNFEPEGDAVSVRSRGGVADPPVMVRDVEAVELQHERSGLDQALVLVAAVSALTGEQLLIPAATPRYVGHGDQGLGTHPARPSLTSAYGLGGRELPAGHSKPGLSADVGGPPR
jgi:hypothetical protein